MAFIRDRSPHIPPQLTLWRGFSRVFLVLAWRLGMPACFVQLTYSANQARSPVVTTTRGD